MLATVSHYVVVRTFLVSRPTAVFVSGLTGSKTRASSATLFTLMSLMMKWTTSIDWRTEIPHTRSQVYSLSNFLFVCQDGSASPCSGSQNVNQLTVFLNEICFKHVTESSRSNHLPSNRISQYDINHKINEPKQMGQTIRAKFCIFIKPSILAFWSSQVYSLSKGHCFAMQSPWKGQSANSFSRRICFKTVTESSR